MEKLCPFRLKSEKEQNCFYECMLNYENKCALLNLGKIFPYAKDGLDVSGLNTRERICPFSNEQCNSRCALYAENNRCALRHLAYTDFSKI